MMKHLKTINFSNLVYPTTLLISMKKIMEGSGMVKVSLVPLTADEALSQALSSLLLLTLHTAQESCHH